MNKKGKILLAIFAVLIFSAMIVGVIAIVPKNDNDNGSNVQKEYTISYFTNGGQGQIQSMHVKAKKTVVLSQGNEFSRTGYTLSSWNTKSDGTGTVYSLGHKISKYTASDNLNLYAIWNANSYTLKYDANGGTGSAPDQTIVFDSNTGVNSGENFTKDGYAFYSWNTEADGSGENIYGMSPYSFAKDATLYAVWKREISYDTNGGQNFVASQYVNDGETFQLLPKEACRKTGYVVSKWKDKDNGTIYDPKQEITYNLGAPLKLIAVWEEATFEIKYYDKNGVAFSGDDSLLPKIHRYFSNTTLVEPTKEGYSFAGWYKNANCSGEKVTVLNAEEYDKNIVLYALWTKNRV